MYKSLFLLISFLILWSCSSSPNKNSDEVQEVVDDCPTFVSVGKVRICLPEIDSMVESYNDSITKAWADSHELKTNSILSFYLKNPTFFRTLDNGDKAYDDFFKIYQVNNLKDLNVDEKYLDEVANSIATNNTFYSWGETLRKMATQVSFIPADQPYFIDQYTPHPNVRSFVVLYRVQYPKYESVLIGVMNIMLIKKRLVGLTYYKAFLGQETLSKARTKNDAIVGKVMAVNEVSSE
jgi:hypothetical protein